jgi:hypothetical protein
MAQFAEGTTQDARRINPIITIETTIFQPLRAAMFQHQQSSMTTLAILTVINLKSLHLYTMINYTIAPATFLTTAGN